jgi:peptide/nickel transport system ATP-binding protein
MSAAEPPETLLRVENLRVSFGRAANGQDRREVVRGVSFGLRAGECLAIVGESGSGKSVTARTLIGLTGAGAEVTADRLEFRGQDLRGLDDRRWRRVRGAQIGFVLQDALVSLDQLRPVGAEIAEGLRLHRWGTRPQRAARVLELLRLVGVPEPEVRARQRPHELSGGLRQRALIAAAIALDPALVVADEPTTALDVTVQAQVLDLLAATKERGKALILISHDLAVVARMADQVVVMRDGVVVEAGPAATVLHRPEHPYTQALLAAIPSAHTRGTRLSAPDPAAAVPSPASLPPAGPVGASLPPAPGEPGTPVIEARGLTKRYTGPDGSVRTVVRDVSFDLYRGETLGIVGESGSGKTTTARLALALVEPDAGTVRLNGRPWSEVPARQRRARRADISVVYQDPLSSFDPRWSVARILDDALPGDRYRGGVARAARVRELAALVGLETEHLERRPLRLSGGQRQRVAIARALAPDPSVIVCDEPVSALDVSIQAQVLDLLTRLQAELGLSYLFISHDLGVIHHLSDRVLVMKDGEVVEHGPADDIFERPEHPYTRELLAALPRLVPAP